MIDMMLALVLFLFPLAYSPGPGNMFFAAIGARDGFAATLAANSGYHVATLVVTLAIGFGFSTIINTVPQMLEILRWVGCAYVVYLAWKIARSAPPEAVGVAKAAGFWDGVLLLALNPKAYVILALMFTQFATNADATTIVWISVIFTLNNLVAFSAYAYAGHRLLVLTGRGARARIVNLAFAAILMAVALWMFLR